MTYTLDEIFNGDEVIFESTQAQSNHDLYWKVTGKYNGSVLLHLGEMGFNEFWSIKPDQIMYLLPTSKLRSQK